MKTSWAQLTAGWVAAVVCLLLAPPEVFAQEARLKNITLRKSDLFLTVSFEVEGAFSKSVTEAVLKGVPADFAFFISLNRSRRMWFDKELAAVEVRHKIKYDSLKKEFQIFRPWAGDEPAVTGSFAEAQKLMTEIRDLPLIGLDQLEKGRTYELWAKAELSRMTLPFYLHYVFYFVTLWDFETDWHTVDFVF